MLDLVKAVLEEADPCRLLGPGWQDVRVVRKGGVDGYALVGKMDTGRVLIIELDLPDMSLESPSKMIDIVERALLDALNALGSVGRPASLFVKA